MATYDLVLKSATVVDPANNLEEYRDVAVAGGRIEAVEPSISTERASDVIDLAGKVIVPGIIDTHIHVGGYGPRERAIGHKMVAETGVVTGIDMASLMDVFMPGVVEMGAGMNVGSLFVLSPPTTVSSQDPDKEEIRRLVSAEVAKGALGLKLIGGHRPLTPEATARGIEVANGIGVYVAYHVGTTESSSNLLGMREIPRLIGNNHLHVAHVSAYCRGMILDPVSESRESLDILHSLKGQAVSETYLTSQIGTGNATSGECAGDDVADQVTQNCLKMRSYRLTRAGLRQAIIDGYCGVYTQRGGRVVLIRGQEAVRLWEGANTQVSVSFSVTPAISSFYTTIARDEEGDFIVDALSTDGGALPRNYLVERGLALVRLGALTLKEYVIKTSLNPARMFGLTTKGHLSPGADADITVLDLEKGVATMSFARGNMIMVNGVSVGKGGTLLVTEAGAKAAAETGLPVQVVDLSRSRFYGAEGK